jgi:adenylate cyclase
MTQERVQRRLAAILAADVVGYGKLMGADEEGTFTRLKAHQGTLVEPIVRAHRGRIFKTTGDGMLVEFSSAVDSLCCALEIQRSMSRTNADVPKEQRIQFRVGINVGDIIVDGGDVYGDAVNMAARLESLANPGGIYLSDDAHRQVLGKLDVTFDDEGEHTLKNIVRPVRIYSVHLEIATTPRRPTLPMPDKPSIAVLPFENLSADPEQEYFADGMVEEIITALSRIRWLFVIARNSSFVYKHQVVDIKQVGRELGVRYALEGSVRRAGDKLRIAGQLIDTATGSHIWANRYDGVLSDVFDLQDRIAESVVGAIQPSILAAEMERSARKRPGSLIAYDYVLRALPLVWSLDRAQSDSAQDLLERALSVEPDYPLALSLAAWCHAQRAVYNWTDALDEEREMALRLAQRAAAISRDDPMVLAILGAAHTIARDLRIAAEHLERALSLDPNSAWAWSRSGWLNVHRGCPELAIQQFERAIRLSPFDPAGFACFFGIACACFLEGQYDEAVEWSHKGLSQQPEAAWQLRVLVPALIHAGRREEAHQAFETLMKHYPGLTISKVRNALPFAAEMVERIVDGLRQTGLPE